MLTPRPDAPTAVERSIRDTIAALGEVDVVTLPHVGGPEPSLLAAAGGTLPWERWLGR